MTTLYSYTDGAMFHPSKVRKYRNLEPGSPHGNDNLPKTEWY